MALGHRERDKVNSATWHGHLEFLLAKRKRLARGHHSAMPYGELASFLVGLQERTTVAARALDSSFSVFAGPARCSALGGKNSDLGSGPIKGIHTA
jgi:hypothetical protein